MENYLRSVLSRPLAAALGLAPDLLLSIPALRNLTCWCCAPQASDAVKEAHDLGLDLLDTPAAEVGVNEASHDSSTAFSNLRYPKDEAAWRALIDILSTKSGEETVLLDKWVHVQGLQASTRCQLALGRAIAREVGATLLVVDEVALEQLMNAPFRTAGCQGGRAKEWAKTPGASTGNAGEGSTGAQEKLQQQQSRKEGDGGGMSSSELNCRRSRRCCHIPHRGSPVSTEFSSPECLTPSALSSSASSSSASSSASSCFPPSTLCSFPNELSSTQRLPLNLPPEPSRPQWPMLSPPHLLHLLGDIFSVGSGREELAAEALRRICEQVRAVSPVLLLFLHLDCSLHTHQAFFRAFRAGCTKARPRGVLPTLRAMISSGSSKELPRSWLGQQKQQHQQQQQQHPLLVVGTSSIAWVLPGNGPSLAPGAAVSKGGMLSWSRLLRRLGPLWPPTPQRLLALVWVFGDLACQLAIQRILHLTLVALRMVKRVLRFSLSPGLFLSPGQSNNNPSTFFTHQIGIHPGPCTPAQGNLVGSGGVAEGTGGGRGCDEADESRHLQIWLSQQKEDRRTQTAFYNWRHLEQVAAALGLGVPLDRPQVLTPLLSRRMISLWEAKAVLCWALGHGNVATLFPVMPAMTSDGFVLQNLDAVASSGSEEREIHLDMNVQGLRFGLYMVLVACWLPPGLHPQQLDPPNHSGFPWFPATPNQKHHVKEHAVKVLSQAVYQVHLGRDALAVAADPCVASADIGHGQQTSVEGELGEVCDDVGGSSSGGDERGVEGEGAARRVSQAEGRLLELGIALELESARRGREQAEMDKAGLVEELEEARSKAEASEAALAQGVEEQEGLRRSCEELSARVAELTSELRKEKAGKRKLRETMLQHKSFMDKQVQELRDVRSYVGQTLAMACVLAFRDGDTGNPWALEPHTGASFSLGFPHSWMSQAPAENEPAEPPHFQFLPRETSTSLNLGGPSSRAMGGRSAFQRSSTVNVSSGAGPWPSAMSGQSSGLRNISKKSNNASVGPAGLGGGYLQPRAGKGAKAESSSIGAGSKGKG